MPRPGESHIFAKNREEHDELRELLGHLQHALSHHQESVEQIRDRIRSLDRYLRAHFEEEEQGGFFRQITEDAPRLAERSEAIESEHAWLAVAMTELVELADETERDDWWQAMTMSFHEFSKQLMHHETKENDLLQEAYTEDIGAAD